MNGTHQDTIRIHAGYIEIHQDTYPIGNPRHPAPLALHTYEPDPAASRSQSASPRLTRYRTLRISETTHARAEHGLFHVQCRGACEVNM
jgi:hypothetical protein